MRKLEERGRGSNESRTVLRFSFHFKLFKSVFKVKKLGTLRASTMNLCYERNLWLIMTTHCIFLKKVSVVKIGYLFQKKNRTENLKMLL